MCVFFGCSDAPRVRLVKDNDTTFHTQWDEPLKEERIILIRRSGEVVRYRSRYNPSSGRVRTAEQKFSLSESQIGILVYFPAGSFVSAPVSSQNKSDSFYGGIYAGSTWSVEYIHSVETLPADLRNTIAVPAHLYEIRDGVFEWHGGEVILRDHPFFREYRVGKPSRLTFTVK